MLQRLKELAGHGLPDWAPLAAALALAWANFLFTSKWRPSPGALHGWRRPWYAAALVAATALAARWPPTAGHDGAGRSLSGERPRAV